MRSTGSEAASALLSFGGVPRRALGRLVTEGTAVSIAPVDYRGLLRAPDRTSEILLMSRDEQSQLVGAGWSSVAVDAGGGFRWMTAPEARVLLPVARAGARRIRIQAFRDANGPGSIRLALNGATLPWQPLQRGWQAYEWGLPEGLLQPGPIEAAVIVDALPASANNEAPRAVAIADIRLIAR